MTAADIRLGRVDAVCVVHAIRDSGSRRVPVTAIDKRPVSDPVHVGPHGLTGDRQCDTEHHGGRYKAVYVYGEDEAQRWVSELGRDLPAGWFGENLRLSGIPTTDAVIGERWAVGTGGLVLEVTEPRTPCGTFGRWAAEPRWVKRFTERGDTGAYLKVVAEGPVAAGDPIEVLSVPAHGVTVRDMFTGRDPDRLAVLLEQQQDLSPTLVEKVRRRLAVRQVQGAM
ncbi:MOSC domain-containing protein [Rhodococcus sp. HM1]|uniref:MOSC domain-containing protein n=1 Tax=unclassified Rhodococcus (in: high G+C Gram-positive bacteria) TaxID=192944 RepID=UPI0018CDBF2C|nr:MULTISPECIES: MOSC domain-containing protein [unclassified Rhodococcus (in: high G+C Gram-positive bacteria)]MBH0121395.1 MOSC domain-containing protein [Rhodococcus sp. CX]MCK8670699.1 MOSC domain-containing protein [Rhodococcus sp. HM1]